MMRAVRGGRVVDPVVRSLAERARSTIEAAEAAGTIPTDRAEWLACAAQEVADGRVPAPPGVAGVRAAIIGRANEMICVGPLVTDAELPVFAAAE